MRRVVFCSWKPGLDSVLSALVLERICSEICVVAERASEIARTLLHRPELAAIEWLDGAPFNEEVLRKAQLERCEKIVLIADWSNHEQSVTESDARTVLTAMAVKKIVPRGYLAAEILDLEFLPYLRMANVNEILYSRETMRSLVASATGSAGIVHVLHDIMALNGGSTLRAIPINDEQIGRSFGSLVEVLEQTDQTICIGILENTIDLGVLKREALSEAQKSLEMKTVLEKLARVKSIELNRPMLAPEEDYVIPPHALALVLSKDSGSFS